jgi:4,5-DOPA dioxygenase extradiol
MTEPGAAIRMPALFLAHGNPMNALADNDFTQSLVVLAADLPRPKAILVVSAHWVTGGTHVLASAKPRTIHDFGGFPPELYEVQYPADGSPEYAQLVRELIPEAHSDVEWGLDHASWTVLRHMWPEADVPVFELSLDAGSSAEKHWELGRRLAALRDAGVLVVGSGNIVHSFAGIRWEPDASAHPWAIDFDAWIADAIVRRDRSALVNYHSAGAIARLSVPTNEHYLPLLYAAAMCDERDPVTFTHTGIEMASMSMRCVRFG